MINHGRDFKGVWIPKEIWLSEELSLMEKVLFTEIQSLDNERGCFASNRYLAGFFGISERQIRTYVSSLQKKGFVKVTIRNRNERVIRCLGRFSRVPDAVRAEVQSRRDDLVKQFTASSGRRRSR